MCTSLGELELCCLCEIPADAKLDPCRHIVMCYHCANKAKRCPTCRVIILGVYPSADVCFALMYTLCANLPFEMLLANLPTERVATHLCCIVDPLISEQHMRPDMLVEMFTCDMH